MTEYNAVSWAVADLLSDIRRRARIDDNAVDYTDTVLLREATDAIWTRFSTELAVAGGGRLLRVVTRDASADYKNADADEYDLPPMAVGDNISSVWFRTSDETDEYRLELISIDRAPLYVGPDTTSDPRWFAVLGGRIRVFPRPSTNAGTLRIVYARRHGELVPLTSCRLVSTVTDPGGGLTRLNLSSAPPGSWSTSNKFDVIDPFYPHRIQDADVTFSSVATTMVIDESYSTASLRFKAGQYIALAGQTPFVQLPLEMRGPLSEIVASQVLMQIDDKAGAMLLEKRALDSAINIARALAPRVRGKREKIIHHNSPLRQNARRGW